MQAGTTDPATDGDTPGVAERLLRLSSHRYVALTTVVGMVVLVALSVVQKWAIGAPVGRTVGYVVPAIFGAGTGFVYGYFNVGRKRRIRALERETELRRLVSAVNHSLVKAESVEEMAPQIADIVGSSPLFECTYVHLFEPPTAGLTCVRNTERSEAAVESVHTDQYVEDVFDATTLLIEDVTSPPYSQHDPDTPAHAGVAIAIGHGGERYGVLTVHFHPGIEPTGPEIELLETIGTDFGYFVHTRILEAERQSFAEIIERIDDPVMIQDREGNFQVLNQAVTTITGRSREALLGSDETRFMDEESARTIADMKARVLETETSVSYQISPTFPDGQERTFSTTRYPYYDETGQLDGTIAICRDVTDLETQERQLRVLDRVLRHNVNNNMNVVQGYAEMIESEATGVIAEHAEKIAANSGRLLDIAHKQRKITDFLSEPQSKETIELAGLLDRIVGRVEAEFPAAAVDLECPGSVYVWATRSVGDAVEELLTNSYVHAEDPDPNPRVAVEAGSETVRIHVEDDNRPIPEMDRDVLSGRDELGALRHGSGLGLWLVKLVVDHAGGTVTYEERTPRGNRVTIELPAGSGEDRVDPVTDLTA
jgi:PAS domain S-box-containing protein